MEQEMPDYETICAAVVGEKWALEKVLDCYGDEINRLAMVKKCQPDGTIKEEIDEDLRQTLCQKLSHNFQWKRSDTMTRGEIWKDFFKRNVLPAVIALFLFFMFKNIFTEDGQTNYFYVWLCCGIPFGIRRMFVWLVPHGYDIAGTVGIVAINFILDGIIGGGILIWRLVVATWYIPLTIYRLLTADKSATPQINIEKGFKSYE